MAAAGGGNEEAVSSGGENKTEGTGAAPPPEPLRPGADSEPNLGTTLVAARGKRGLSRAEVVAQTRIPAHYLQMMESSDYGLISDQLYLLPFLRRYAAFLGLDGEEVAMRFVREVQRAEGAPPARMSEPLTLAENKRSHWGRALAAAAVLAAIVVLYFLAAQRHRAAFQPPAPALPASAGAPGAAPPPLAAAPAAAQAEAPPKVPDTSVVANHAVPSAAAGPHTSEPMRAAPHGPAAPSAASGASSARTSGRPAGSESR
jgi:cytoskeleton protein RodZ